MKLRSFIGFRLNQNFLNPTKRINEIFCCKQWRTLSLTHTGNKHPNISLEFSPKLVNFLERSRLTDPVCCQFIWKLSTYTLFSATFFSNTSGEMKQAPHWPVHCPGG